VNTFTVWMLERTECTRASTRVSKCNDLEDRDRTYWVKREEALAHHDIQWYTMDTGGAMEGFRLVLVPRTFNAYESWKVYRYKLTLVDIYGLPSQAKRNLKKTNKHVEENPNYVADIEPWDGD